MDGVASMLYRDYGRNHGEWIPNKLGGRENLEAVEFLKQLNTTLYLEHPGVQTMAEESTSWPLVSKPTYVGGLGFGFKWDMGWMHDTLEYLQEDPIYRRFHQNKLTFRSMYAYSEHFVLPLSHDEVVYGKGSLINKMPGDEWQKLANLRLLYSYMWAQPGKKMLFMGGELGQYKEWNHDASLDWHLAENPGHAALGRTVERLNELYREEKALHVKDADSGGFEWIDGSNAQQSVVVFLRRGETGKDVVLCAFNFTPQVQHAYRIGVPLAGGWREIFNSGRARVRRPAGREPRRRGGRAAALERAAAVHRGDPCRRSARCTSSRRASPKPKRWYPTSWKAFVKPYEARS